MAQQHEHLTTEQLSAYLDKQLAPQEQAACEAHMRTCAQCQQSLAQLRQTVALLHALPQAELPRSFVLPADMTLAPVRTRSQQESHIIPMARQQHPAWTHIVRSSLRAVSTIAAVLAIVFMMSSLLTLLPAHTGSSTSTNASNTYAPLSRTPSAAQSGGSEPHATTATRTAQADKVKKTPTSGPSPTPAVHQSSQGTDREAPPGPSAFDLSMPGSRLLAGALLLLLSILGIFFTRRRQPHAQEI